MRRRRWRDRVITKLLSTIMTFEADDNHGLDIEEPGLAAFETSRIY